MSTGNPSSPAHRPSSPTDSHAARGLRPIDSVTAAIAARLGDIRPVRPEVVGRLRRELAAGHYAPPIDQVANSLVGPLLSRQPRLTRWR